MNFDSDALSRFLSGVMTVKFGPGAIGRIGTVALISVASMTLICFVIARMNVWAGLAAFGVLALFAFTFLIIAFVYAWRHPELSAMDGAQVSKVMLHQGAIRPLDGLQQPPPIVGEVIQNPLIEKLESGE
ncbi:hypothetical protein D3C72_275680 [compost metagenome]